MIRYLQQQFKIMSELPKTKEQQMINVEAGFRTIEKIASELGYQATSINDITLTETETKQLSYIKKISGNDVRIFKAMRTDGLSVKTIIRPTGTGDYTAEIFTPAFYEGHGSNHDFNESELTGILKTALTSPPHQSPKH